MAENDLEGELKNILKSPIVFTVMKSFESVEPLSKMFSRMISAVFLNFGAEIDSCGYHF